MKFSKLGLIFRGLTMGIAEVIPGVSGGTIAFITGIYQSLLDAIKSVDKEWISLLLQVKFKKAWDHLNGNFLLWLVIGMLGGILIGVFGVSYLLDNYPEVLWSLFFGLILASVPLMLTQVTKKSGLAIALFILGALIAYGVTSLSPTEGSTNYLYVYIAGMIAISALVLPGISGSLMLLLMGLYTTIIPTLKSFLKAPDLASFLLLAVFALGCLTGLMLFSRLVSAAFARYQNQTIALLSGFMLGSLNKIWPWRNPLTYLDKDKGEFIEVTKSNFSNFNPLDENLKILKEQNVWPSDYYYEPRTALVIGAFLLGLALIYALHRSGLMSNKQAD